MPTRLARAGVLAQTKSDADFGRLANARLRQGLKIFRCLLGFFQQLFQFSSPDLQHLLPYAAAAGFIVSLAKCGCKSIIAAQGLEKLSPFLQGIDHLLATERFLLR